MFNKVSPVSIQKPATQAFRGQTDPRKNQDLGIPGIPPMVTPQNWAMMPPPVNVPGSQKVGARYMYG